MGRNHREGNLRTDHRSEHLRVQQAQRSCGRPYRRRSRRTINQRHHSGHDVGAVQARGDDHEFQALIGARRHAADALHGPDSIATNGKQHWLLPPFKAIVVRPCLFTMRSAAIACIAATASLLLPMTARAISLEQACARFAERLNSAQSSGDIQKAQAIYQQGSQRIASRFNGATCPNVKSPTP